MINKGNNNLNALRMLGVQAVNKANSGHPGIVLGAAPIVFTLFTKFMKHNPKDPKWFDRDHFILSAGHGSALLYSALHLSGYADVTMEDLKQFRQYKSKTAGHPEKHLINGVEVTTGPLGQGIAMGVGFAIAEAHLSAKYNKENNTIIDHNTYILCGDGDLQEGISQEAISFAGVQKLNKIILIHDSNDIQLDDKVCKVSNEDLHKRFKSANWNTIKVKDGENLKAIEKAIMKAQKSDKPTYIEVKTIIGLGTTKQGTSSVHGAPIGTDIETVKNNLDWHFNDFEIPSEVVKFWKENTVTRGAALQSKWVSDFADYKKSYKSEAEELLRNINKEYKFDFKALLKDTPTKPEATRISSGNIFKALATGETSIIGGSADLSSSTKISGVDGEFTRDNRTGRNILYGVREFAMAAMNNGIAAHTGLLPVSSGFFVFSDYMKPAMRLTSIMNLQQLFIFTHDSIAVGEDGPTHEPVEQLAMVRSIPNHIVIRPADYAETVAAYKLAVMDFKEIPTTLALTRQDLMQLPHKNVFDEVKKGAYVMADEKGAQVTIIATGSEVGLAMQVKEELHAKSIKAKVVSMPSTSLFDQQSEDYKSTILDRSTLLVGLEMGSSFGWHKYVGLDGLMIGIDTFGESAPGNTVIKHFGFTKEEVTNKIVNKLKSITTNQA